MSDYPDAPLMILTGACGIWFLVLGIRAIRAQRRATHETPAPMKEEPAVRR